MNVCTVTYGCDGELFPVHNITEIINTKPIPPNVPGLTNWIQKRLIYNHTQRFVSDEWTIVHNLQCVPIVHITTNLTQPDGTIKEEWISPVSITTVDENTTKVKLAKAYAGKAQCVTATSQRIDASGPELQLDEYIQISSNGTITLASNALKSPGGIDLSATFTDVASTATVDVRYDGITNSTSTKSPWALDSEVLIGGKKFSIGSFDINTPSAPSQEEFNNITYNTSNVEITGLPSTYRTTMILLSHYPYTFADRVVDRMIDLAYPFKEGDLVYRDRELYVRADSDMIRDIFLPIMGAK